MSSNNDVNVHIGKGFCGNVIAYADRITCLPPSKRPAKTAADESLEEYTFKLEVSLIYNYMGPIPQPIDEFRVRWKTMNNECSLTDMTHKLTFSA